MSENYYHKVSNPKKKVSILIPSYNTKVEYVRDCLFSIKNQIGNFGIEIVWIDDCSNNSDDQLNELTKMKSIPNTKITYKKLEENKGISNALNVGIDLCSNEIIMRMDADDIMKNTRIQTQLNFMSSHKDCVCCGTDILPFYADGSFGVIDPREPVIKEDTFVKNPIYWISNHPTLCYKKSAVEKVGKYILKREYAFEDFDLLLRLLKRYKVLYNINEVLLMYRIHSNQITLRNRHHGARNNKLKMQLVKEYFFPLKLSTLDKQNGV